MPEVLRNHKTYEVTQMYCYFCWDITEHIIERKDSPEMYCSKCGQYLFVVMFPNLASWLTF